VDSKGHTGKGKKDNFHLSLEREIEEPGITLGVMGQNSKTKGSGRLGFKKHFPFLQSPGGKVSLEIDHTKQPLDHSCKS